MSDVKVTGLDFVKKYYLNTLAVPTECFASTSKVIAKHDSLSVRYTYR